MADWSTIASVATAGGTLILAIATFSSVRSGNRSARVAERALQLNIRPVLVPSRLQDPAEKVPFMGGRMLKVAGGSAAVEQGEGNVYMAMGLRNVGSGIAVLDGWHLHPGRRSGTSDHADLAEFRRLTRDLYIAAGDTGYWQGAVRDPADGVRSELESALEAGEPLTIELLYGDHEGHQRTITRFLISPGQEDRWFCAVSRHWSLDGAGPRG